MSVIAAAAAALVGACRTVPDVRVVERAGDTPDPPAVYIGPPALTWEGAAGYGPTSARFVLSLIVPGDDRVLDRLYELVPLIVAAVDELDAVGEIRADPAVYGEGDAALPAYQITVEYAL